MEAVKKEVAIRRKVIFLEMRDSGMTYREIAKETGISFGRVRQILAKDLNAEPSEE
ncbi:sigma factor-like helix-turn-helix DNA-binding protein [Streptomyces sp. NPDC059371]|uniref:sigma factor-like helix-turn-helix DNA-binding protein n=1 Tax=Streptomyces sp. NPDC059371 TaxID=3346812 RepID=UPI0036C1935A